MADTNAPFVQRAYMSKINLPYPLRFLWNQLAKPPYAGVVVAVCLYVMIVCLIYPYNGPFTGHMIGFDDQARMVQALQLVNGGGWYDRTIMRVNGPEGFETIWARIVDIPIVLVVMLGQLFVDQKTAAMASTVILPFVELILLFFAARYAARPLVGKGESWLVVLFVAMTSVLNRQNFTFSGFHIGEASHHSWYIILNVVMTGAVVRMALGVRSRSPDIWLAVAISLFLAVGIEGFPLIAGAIAVLALIAWGFDAPRLARRSAKAVAGGALLAFLLLPIHQPPQKLFIILFSQPSFLGPVLVGAAALFLLIEGYALSFFGKRKLLSLISLGVCATLLAGLLIFFFPQILDGPAAALSPLERQLASVEHPEAWSMWRATLTGEQFVGLVAPGVIAMIAGLVSFFSTSHRRQRIKFLSYLGLTAVSNGLAQIYFRYVHHAMVSACPMLLWLWQRIRSRLRKRRVYVLASLLAFLSLGPFWMIVVPVLDTPTPMAPQIYAFPATMFLHPYRCDILDFAHYLNDHYTPDTVLNVPDSLSAFALYQTHLKIDFLANFPSQNKFIDNKTFFMTQDIDQARAIAKRHGFDLVGLCALFPLDPSATATRPYRDPMMVEKLIEGHPPSWLKPVDMGTQTDFLLFEVDKKALAETPK